jgi:hypothetical protein
VLGVMRARYRAFNRAGVAETPLVE